MAERVLAAQRREIRLVLVPGTKGAGRLDPSARNRIGDARLESPRLAAPHAIHREVVDLEDPRQPSGSHGWISRRAERATTRSMTIDEGANGRTG